MLWYKTIVNKWERFWRLVALWEAPKIKGRRAIKCLCDCWEIKNVKLEFLRKGDTKSCWCLHRENSSKRMKKLVVKQKKSKKKWINKKDNRMYRIRWSMKGRCYNKNHTSYRFYWARGVTVCDEWYNSFDAFYRDMHIWYNDKLSIDRIDSKLNYCKENCKRSTYKEQSRNKRSNVFFKGKIISEWADILWIESKKIYNRKNILWRTIEEAIFWKKKK